ncbi:isoprenyl transferase [Crenothrix polyspora]|jgi:undecaprenyl diphosphate synthase|uniref:Ditrans,polycis-undecaprenyl-diphosphate synthase ((2E,6E)-farnesyl-diphosphate specific) n=1 Tax=Crenothrix polyspora TaxID=360316 RepID=A0A1R4H0A5_9GAMM|nr:isoprenyl transferase [Crenothrix polyspora]SJM89687.1 undecaprenyl pyrophosphate synthase [Crenothrix polyspora]
MSADGNDSPESCNDNPRHIAIIMDGNGRWAQKRFMPRAIGHQAGVKTVRKIVEYCAVQKIEALSLFAFSSENWRRPQDEVSLLMELFMVTLGREIKKLDRNNIRLKFIGDRSLFPQRLQDKMNEGEAQTQNNTALTLVVAVNYGGRWDMCQAFQQVAGKIAAGELSIADVNPQLLNQYLSTADLPEPDLFIRTGGEQRISNFMLWQLAYTEFYFTPTLWPDFDQDALATAIESFKVRERRFGHTSEQVRNKAVTL